MKKNLPGLLLILSSFILLHKNIYGQYTVEDNKTATELASTLIGGGVTLLNATLDCNDIANGIFSGTGDLGIDSGIVLTSGRVKTLPTSDGVNGPFTFWGIPSEDMGLPGDADLNTVLSPLVSTDACVLEFDFIPFGDTVKFNYIFASSEYGDYSCSSYNDIFGFFISGGAYTTPYNIALIPGTSIPVCVNSTTGVGTWVATDPECNSMGTGSPFSTYYVDNTDGSYITYGGLTTVFQAVAPVQACDTYTLKLAIGDGSPPGAFLDRSLDSGVFLEAGSFFSTTDITTTTYGGGGLEPPYNDCVRGCNPSKITITREGNLDVDFNVNYTMGGTAVNGVDYEYLSGSTMIPAGETSVDLLIKPLTRPFLVGTKTVFAMINAAASCSSTGDYVVTDTINIYDSLYVDILQEDMDICMGFPVKLQVAYNERAAFQWLPAGIAPGDITNPDIVVHPVNDTRYIATATIPNLGCPVVRDTVAINVNPNPDVAIHYDFILEELCLYDTVSLTATGASSFSFYNMFDEMISQNSQARASLQYKNNTFSVVGVNEFGCKDTSMINIYVEPCCDLVVPSAFSPNGDGLNDGFGAVSKGSPQNYKLDIYNRWGERIYTSYDIHDKWNGKIQDGYAGSGTYYYVIGVDCDGTRKQYSGDITLIR